MKNYFTRDRVIALALAGVGVLTIVLGFTAKAVQNRNEVAAQPQTASAEQKSADCSLEAILDLQVVDIHIMPPTALPDRARTRPGDPEVNAIAARIAMDAWDRYATDQIDAFGQVTHTISADHNDPHSWDPVGNYIEQRCAEAF